MNTACTIIDDLASRGLHQQRLVGNLTLWDTRPLTGHKSNGSHVWPSSHQKKNPGQRDGWCVMVWFPTNHKPGNENKTRTGQ